MFLYEANFYYIKCKCVAIIFLEFHKHYYLLRIRNYIMIKFYMFTLQTLKCLKIWVMKGWLLFFSYICLSAGAVEWRFFLLCYNSIIPYCPYTSKRYISDSAICHLWRFISTYWHIGRHSYASVVFLVIIFLYCIPFTANDSGS